MKVHEKEHCEFFERKLKKEINQQNFSIMGLLGGLGFGSTLR